MVRWFSFTHGTTSKVRVSVKCWSPRPHFCNPWKKGACSAPDLIARQKLDRSRRRKKNEAIFRGKSEYGFQAFSSSDKCTKLLTPLDLHQSVHLRNFQYPQVCTLPFSLPDRDIWCSFFAVLCTYQSWKRKRERERETEERRIRVLSQRTKLEARARISWTSSPTCIINTLTASIVRLIILFVPFCEIYAMGFPFKKTTYWKIILMNWTQNSF